MTFRGAVVGCDPIAAGPSGRARCRKESGSVILLIIFAVYCCEDKTE